MNRLIHTIAWDIRIQYRNGFYYAALVVLAMFGLLLLNTPKSSHTWLVPLTVFSNLSINAFYFIGALVLLEKGERTLEAQSVTPLSPTEYLLSKCISLALLSLVENLTLVVVVMGTSVNYVALSVGILLFSMQLSLFGFWVVVRYDSLNEYLFPSFLYTMPLSLPLLDYFGLWSHWLLYLFPNMSPLFLFQRAFSSASTTALLYAAIFGSLWIWLLLAAARHAYNRFIRTTPDSNRHNRKARLYLRS